MVVRGSSASHGVADTIVVRIVGVVVVVAVVVAIAEAGPAAG